MFWKFRKRCKSTKVDKGVFLRAVATYAAGGSTSSDGMRAVIPCVRTYEPVPCWLPVWARRTNSGMVAGLLGGLSELARAARERVSF